jgi:3-deoxy-7-phosphoheptulonate synthase
MVIVMEAGASAGQLGAVLERVTTSGFRPHVNDGVERKVIAVLGEVDIDKVELLEQFENLPGVERVDLISAPFKLSSRQYQPEDRIVDVGGVLIGGMRVVIMAGPCSVESETQIHEAAQAVKEAGARVLRGGAFKPRSSPHSFQGLENQD